MTLSSPIDAHQLLDALAPLLGPEGCIKGPVEASRISSLMKDAVKMVSKCVYLNILRNTSEVTTLNKFIAVGGWDTLNQWLQDSKEPEFTGFLLELLKVYRDLPITVELLKKNNAAKTIKQFAKSDNESIKVLSSDIVDKWMKTVRGGRADENDKKKEKDKKRKKDKDHHHRHHSGSKDKEGGATDMTGGGSSDANKDKTNDDSAAKRPKTVKTLQSKFRSTGLEDQTIAPVKKKPVTEPKPLPVLPKRNTSSIEEPPEKKSRLTLTIPSPSLSSATTLPTSTSPPSTSPQEVQHGKIKIIPAKRLPTHEIHEDSGFMDSLSVKPRFGGVKKKKKLMSPVTTTTPTTPSGPPDLKPAVVTSPIAVPPVSPITSLASRLPSVPSFYKDTLETAEEPQETKERSPSPEEMNPVNLQMPLLSPERPSTPVDEDMENKNPDDSGKKNEDENNGQENVEDPDQKGLLSTGMIKRKKPKKKLRWVDDNRLCQFHYFEMDETERENVNRPKDSFNSLKKAERMMEGRAMDRKFSHHDNQNEAVQWRKPELLTGLSSVVVPGCNSTERDIQNQREQSVLQALFFSKAMLPDTPTEPDLEAVETEEPINIPLVDASSSGEEYSYTYDNITQKPDKLKPDPPELLQQNNHGIHQGGHPIALMGAPPPGLPPELTNILNNFSKNPPTGNNVSNDMMQNVQNMLAVIMQASQDGNQNQMIDQLRMALEPFRHQLPELFQMGSNFGGSGPNMMGGPPRMGPGLLGAAPPGFAPLGGPRGPPPNRFMGPGPGGQMGMPGPQGPGGPMRGPGPGPGPQGGPMGPGPGDEWGDNMMGGHMGPGGPMGPNGPRHNFQRRGGPMNRGPMRGGRGGNRGGRDNRGPDRGGNRDDRRDDRGRGGRNDRGRRDNRGGKGKRQVCRHFLSNGGCKFGDTCSFLHPNPQNGQSPVS
ncbi:hypothetical protein LOTGIDRAFT_230041 [Lottia gigantea]|uniref:Serine/threonine-protein phosphatase 1 regulatory subunit 10 n=1 Tax=Lottia gigantea TaxID=225164 RepID=V4BBN1_LOTGI|nr:hypothetical protein LOTGIDRAFT_230041 [Lottia gigantea]ESP04991.1 hypothetical protein LOTGIDRAFT_230041 [Lottia gigantea]